MLDRVREEVVQLQRRLIGDEKILQQSYRLEFDAAVTAFVAMAHFAMLAQLVMHELIDGGEMFVAHLKSVALVR